MHVLQANLRKVPETQLSLRNDQSLQSCDLLIISEPCPLDERRSVLPRTCSLDAALAFAATSAIRENATVPQHDLGQQNDVST